ncbi:hypothetical protein HO133_005159 [Letharia lupina]|uniref:Uncharacterized protein n=1 Tax=Letharia lupina TaxID=560253 RepID=A0A8H6F997_9LECA|nr:uncharacterized protein HO133_005159 [Letharia lupina]KAF6219334.1 hypothetical protein HO133_005159 [Letharia lupina]
MGCRSFSKGEAAASSFSNLAIEALELDISSDSSISKAFATVEGKFGHLDVLINNAGISQRALPEGLTTRQRYAQIMDTNAISAACLPETFIPLLCDTLNPASQYYGLDSPEYKASKAALNMIMATNAVELKGEGFKVNVCCPGLNATGLSGAHPSVGPLNASRLAKAGKDGEHGTFTNKEGSLPW